MRLLRSGSPNAALWWNRKRPPISLLAALGIAAVSVTGCGGTDDEGLPVRVVNESAWDALVVNYETASTVDPGDPESLQRVVAQAVRAERSAIAVHDWLLANCDVDLGNVATIGANRPPPAPPPAGG